MRKFVASSITFLVSSSFSKSFSLYGERVGALTVVLPSADEATRVQSQLKRVIRSNYSNPPTHGAQVVQRVLNDEALRQGWEAELGAMRVRIKAMRKALVAGLAAAGIQRDFSFIEKQRGMFSYSGLTAQQVEALKADHGIYAVSSGRIRPPVFFGSARRMRRDSPAKKQKRTHYNRYAVTQRNRCFPPTL